MRNRAFAVQLGAMVVLSCGMACAAYALAGWMAAALCALTGIALMAVFALASYFRHREIMRLTAEIDEVLHAGRRVTLSTCREGDLAVLRNEVEKMVARLSRTTAQLEHEKSSLADAMADISHQIRTPLTAMALMVPALEQAEDETERKRLVRELEQSVERVSWLVTSLLKMAKIDAGALSIDRRPVNVQSMVDYALRPLAMTADLHGVSLKVMCSEEASFEGDARWSAEALQNVVKNCIEHTPEGGVVDICAYENALATHIEVRDTGCGIDEVDLPHVFERFYRGTHGASEGESLQPEGFGIGLSLASALISAQGGTITAKNTPEGGALFHIAFPKLVV